MSAPDYCSLSSPETRVWRRCAPFELESGACLPELVVAYRTWGRLSPEADNAVIVCHALTGSADVDSWWSGLLGPGRALDTDRDFVVCANMLGSCYGSTGPTHLDPSTGRAWVARFPAVTIRDQVRAHIALVRALGVRRVRLVLGGSIGGMQVLEWALLAPELVEAIAPVAATARQSAWAIGLNEAQRAAVRADANWCDGDYAPERPPRQGLAAARMLAMCSYRSFDSFAERFGRAARGDDFAVASYLRHQGEKLVERFDANSYLALLGAADSHDVGRDRGGHEPALRSIRAPALVVSVDTDVLYLPEEQEELVRLIPAAVPWVLRSPHGHDAFLMEVDALNTAVSAFRSAVARGGALRPRAFGLPVRTRAQP